MDNKKIKTFGAISIGLVTVGIVVAIMSTNESFVNFVSAAEHSDSCVWNHYAKTEPKENIPGNKEYWVCCTDHESVLEEPTVGKISEGEKQLSEAQLKSLTRDDKRYISPSNVTSVINSINNLAELDMSGGVIPNVGYQVVLDEYNKIDDQYKVEVTNSDKLLKFNDYFECVVSSSTLKAFDETTTSDGVDDVYGVYRGFTCTWGKDQKEKGAYYDLITNINFEDYAYFTFAIYNPNQFTGWKFIANDWQKHLDITTNTLVTDTKDTTPPSGWNVVTLSSVDMKSLFCKEDATTQSIYWGPYLGGSAAYGLQINETIKITNFYGIKPAYYESYAQTVVNKINALSSLNKDNLTLWNGGQILEARNEYDALPASAQAYVTNLSTLVDYETAYTAKGVTHNLSWQDGSVEATYVTTFNSTNEIDTAYGFYTQLNDVKCNNGWPNFSPVSDKTISGTGKLAIYVPTSLTVQFYSSGWTALGGDVSLNQGWNEITLENIPENNSVSAISIGFTKVVASNAGVLSGTKITPIYSANN